MVPGISTGGGGLSTSSSATSGVGDVSSGGGNAWTMNVTPPRRRGDNLAGGILLGLAVAGVTWWALGRKK